MQTASTLSMPSAQNDHGPMYHRIRRSLEEQMLMGELPMGAQVPTEQQLCELHGVSRITARRALEDLREAGIIERTRGRGSFVRKLPKGRNVAPTEIGILTGCTDKMIASNEVSWTAQIIRSLDSRLPDKGFHITLLPFEDTRLWERVNTLGPRLAGVLGFADPGISPFLDEFDRRGIPWVTANPISRGQTHNFVSANNFAGGQRVSREFARLNYPSALFIGMGSQYISVSDRFFGFLQGWFEAGGSIEDVRHLEASASEGLNEEETARLLELLTGKNCPRAVFCAGDLLASSVLKACQQCGLAVPEDVAVVGGTGLTLADHTSPTLTVLAQPMVEIGHAAEAMLVEMIRAKQHRMPGRYVTCPLIRRDSCPIGEVP